MKTTILALLTIFFAFIANAQTIQWQNSIGGRFDDFLVSIQQTSDGGYILGGYSKSDSTGDKTENTNRAEHSGWSGWYEDYWIVKLDSIGDIQWENTIGGDSSDVLSSIEQTSDGGYIIGGTSVSNISGDKTENSFGPNSDYWVVKLDALGSILWQNTIGGDSIDILNSVHQTLDGGYILGGYSISNASGDKTENSLGAYDYWVIKLDATGNILWQNVIGGDADDKLYSIEQCRDGGYILGGQSSSNISGDKTENLIGGPWDQWLVKLDAFGNIQWQNTTGGICFDNLYSVRQTTDDGYIIGGASCSASSSDKTENTIAGGWDYWVLKLDTSGNIQWENTIGGSETESLYSIQQTADGGYILGGSSDSNISGDKTENGFGGGNEDYWVIKLDASGYIEWQNTIGTINTDRLYSLQQTNDGGYILGGISGGPINGDKTENGQGWIDYWVIKLKSATNVITGNVFNDLNANCLPDSVELDFRNFLLKAEPLDVYATTDSLGSYRLFVDTGSYTVRPITNHPYLNPQCPASGSYTVNFPDQNDTSSGNNFGMRITSFCPLMEVDISAPSELRRCSPLHGDYIVHYCNNGTAIANNVYISIKKPQDLTFVSSSIPWRTPQTGSVYFFDIGNVGIQECGTLTINVDVSCSAVLGQTLCVLAHIFPDTICRPTPGWDGSSVAVEGICINNDTVQFRISNVGTGDMQDSLNYYIVEDNVMLRSGKFKLLSGAFIRPYELANGSTFRLDAEQSPNHPGKSHPSATVEACGTNGTGGVSLGYTITMPQDDAGPFVSISCEEVIGSYDPNDKVVFPKGIGDDKIISVETELEYKIRFQNTGNDTAFRVVVRDTLSPFLDIATIELGASSHPYDFRIYGTGILEWTFDNILLPDSFVNEPESHGFIQFRVIQIPNNPEGTVIENSADIYFDFNAPVKTNVEFNTVGNINEVLLSVIENVDLHNNISIYPNPFSEYFIVQIDDNPIKQLRFELYDLQGRLNGKREFQNTRKFIINDLNWSEGIYFYRIIADGNVIGTGKILGM